MSRPSRSVPVLVAVALAVIAGGALVATKGREAWTVFRSDIAPGSRQVVAATPAPGGFVVVGFEPTDEGSDAVAWHVRGDTWDEIGRSFPDRMFTDVVVVDDRVLASGSLRGVPAIFDVALGGDRWNVVWRPADNIPGELMAIATGGGVVAAVGSTMSDTSRAGIAVVGNGDGDGDWTLEAVEGDAWLTTVTPVRGTFVAAGQRGGGHAAVWSRGETGGWTSELLPDDGSKRSFATAVAAGAGRTVVVGQIETQPAAWWRTDGAWTAVPMPSDGPGQRVTSVAASEDGDFLAAGTAVGLGDTTRPLAWASRDGGSWSVVGASGANFGGIAAITSDGKRLVAWGNAIERKRIRPDVQELEGSVLQPADL